MKRLLVILMLILVVSLVAQKQETKVNSVSVLSSSEEETILQYKINSYDQSKVKIDNQDWYHIFLPESGITLDKGNPQLPVFNFSIIIDDIAKVELELFDVEYRDVKLPIAPSKGNISRNINPSTIPYEFGTIYQSKEFYPGTMAELSDPYILRDFRGITIKTTPFAYKADTQTLRIYTSYKIRVFKTGIDTINTLSRDRSIHGVSREFIPVYEDRFVNWQANRYTPVSDSFGKLLVICHSNYLTQIAPYVNWKKQKGIETKLVEWSTIGSTAAQLQAYIQSQYNADNALTFVQLVGDHAQIPSILYTSSSNETGGSDPSFALVAGYDNYPDIFIGRFSAETTAQVTTQVNRSITYERDLTVSDTWLSKALGIASDEGDSTSDMGESDIQHMNNIRTKLLNYGYNSVDQVYDPGALASTVSTNVNTGRGFINYVGHGNTTAWGTTDFSTTNASSLSNGTKTPLIMDVACLNGNFTSNTCFAEAWMRNTNGGAITIYASSILQDWSPPMRAQDTFTDLMIAGTRNTAGGLYYNSSCAMMDVYGNTSSSAGVKTYKTWNIFGDASVVMRSKTPQTMTVTHPTQLAVGTSTISVSTGVANTLVALTYNNTIYARGYTDSSGNQVLNIIDAPTTALTYTITATAFNRVTYVGSVQQVTASGPYMSVETTAYADGNNNQADYNESGTLNVTFKNVGSSTASNVTATLSCNTAGITITDNAETIASLSAGSSLTRNGAYAFSIANNVSNGTVAAFTITMVSGSETWTHNFNITLNAPVLALGTMSVNDASGNNNGRLDPGETVTISIPLTNSGGAASPAGSATLSSSTNGITINTGTTNFSAIAASGSSTLSFNVSVSASMSSGSLASFVANATAGAYSANSSQSLEVGTPEQIVIGSGTSTQTYPLERYYNYSTHEAIYLASEIGMPGTISALAYYKSSGTNTDPINSTSIYMKTTSATTLSTGDYSTSGYSLVYSGSFPNTATSGWMEVELSTPFEYNGTANLSILVVKAHEAYISSGYPYWSYTSTTTRARQARSDSAQPVTITATSNLPNLRLKIFASEVEVLNPPQNLSASASHQSVALSWQAPAMGTPTGYKIFKNGSLLTSVSGLSYTDTAVSNGTTYSYYLKAVYSGGESDATSAVTATPNAIAPTNLVAVAGNGLVTISWTAATGRAIEEDLQGKDVRSISGYKVYRNSSAIATTSSTSYQDTGLSNGTSYSYYVTTVYTSPTGESAPSNTATATPQPITEVILGTGTTSTSGDFASPINVYYKSLHGQAVYTAAELTAAGISGPIDITQLGFNITGLPTRNMPNFVVRMKHTTASNVSSWINSTGLVTVYSNASYIPTQTGYNMYTLSTPFTWNGTDNILIDTAFGLLTAEYDESGTVQYTSIANGYRYNRSDNTDQTALFTGGYTSSYRPNLKIAFQTPQVDAALISVSPTSISETLAANGSTTKQLQLSNSGNIALNWSVTRDTRSTARDPWYSLSVSSGTINPGASSTIQLSLDANGLSSGTYTTTITINSNASNNPALIIPVSIVVQPPIYPNQPRFVAEWEPAKGAIVRYPWGLPYSMLRDLAAENLLYVIVTSASQSTANSNLNSNGVNMANVRYINATADSYWVRDYGPWTVMDANNSAKIIDFEYNRPRPNDNAIPSSIATYLGRDYYKMTVNHTGGNIMTDGMGKAMSTELVWDENPTMSTSDIEQMFSTYLGVTEYQVYPDPNNTYIDHIDCWAKLVDVDKVIIRSVPSSHAQYSAIEAVVSLWQSKTSSYGTPYRIFRVYTPNNEPYSNAFILNKKIFVPQMGTANDAAALQIYQNAMPGYTVTGYTHTNFENTDAIHCRANTVFDEQMVSIKHTPPQNLTANASVVLSVNIAHSNPINTEQSFIQWSTSSSGPWQQSNLIYDNTENLWKTNITAPAFNQTLYYWVQAKDTAGKTTTLPLCAGSDPFQVLVNQHAPNNAPTISLPASFSMYDHNTLQVDFSAYLDDDENDELSLTVSGNSNIHVEINGLIVTFSHQGHWTGTEDIVFTVSDGVASSMDTIPVTIEALILEAPQVQIAFVGRSLTLRWQEVQGAVCYKVYGSTSPDTGFELLTTTSDHSMAISPESTMMFYKVIATNVPIQARY